MPRSTRSAGARDRVETMPPAAVPPRSRTRSRPDRATLIATLNWESRRSSVFFGLLNRAVAVRLGVNVTDVEALGVLSVLGTTTPTGLATALGVGTGTMTLVLDRLERAGFVRRVRGAEDRRSVTIELIEERNREAAELYAPLQQVAATILEGYSDRELAVVADYLARSNEMLRDIAAATASDRSPSSG